MPEIHCRHFSGYKPCGLSDQCDFHCPHRDVPASRIVIIQLEAMGSVLRTTGLLPAVRRKYPKAHITWITKSPCEQLLLHNPLIDRIMTTSSEDLTRLQCLEFDAALVLDKSLLAGGILARLKVSEVFGFRIDSRSGAVLPATGAANELWELGLSNHKKFFENTKTELQLMVEALELGPYQRDEYVLELTHLESEMVQLRRGLWAPRGEILLGLNTGCSAVIPYKKLSVEMHRRLITKLQASPGLRIVLLGGPEDTQRNREIAEGFNVIVSATKEGLRDGLCSVAACDLIVTGDSLGMHMAIALKKQVVAWFGPTCEQEIDLFDRGEKILSQASCGPCWKRFCQKPVMCYDLVDFEAMVAAIQRGLACVSSYSKRPISETSFSLSRLCGESEGNSPEVI